MKTLIITLLFVSNALFSQEIQGLSVTQNGANQIKAHLKIYLPSYGEYLSYSVDINQNTITLNACYWTIGAAVVVYPENDFYIDIPNNGNYTLKVNLYISSDETTCDYQNLEDTVSLNFSTPIQGTISLSAIDFAGKDKNIALYPNPSNGLINIKSSNKIGLINVFDASGKQITIIKNPDTKLDLSYLQNGVYFLEVVTDKEKIRKKVVIK